jgi:hypothetical protein
MNEVDNIKFIKRCGMLFIIFMINNSIILLNSFNGLVFVMGTEIYFFSLGGMN